MTNIELIRKLIVLDPDLDVELGDVTEFEVVEEDGVITIS